MRVVEDVSQTPLGFNLEMLNDSMLKTTKNV